MYVPLALGVPVAHKNIFSLQYNAAKRSSKHQIKIDNYKLAGCPVWRFTKEYLCFKVPQMAYERISVIPLSPCKLYNLINQKYFFFFKSLEWVKILLLKAGDTCCMFSL